MYECFEANEEGMTVLREKSESVTGYPEGGMFTSLI